MGVQGLSTFVDQHPELLTDLKLCNTKVVIDGNNLFYFLYHLYRVNCTYGGDYDVYASKVTSYFKILLSVGVEPHVMFDGCYDRDDRKLQTTLKRMRDKIGISHRLSKGGSGSLLPLMAQQVFRDVLLSLGISHCMCEEEADGECAALANQLQCPVMSNDSDFYIYDLSHGFILFDYLNLQVATGKDENGVQYKYLNAQVYYLDNMLKRYNKLTRESIPLFATIMGNDFVEHNYFKDFFRSANVTLGRRQVSKRRHYKMEQVLGWMNHYKGDILTKILECMPKEKKEHVKDMIDFSMELYTKMAKACKVGESRTDSILSAGHAEASWRTFTGNAFPSWFVSIAKEGRTASQILNALVLGKVLMPCQVELRQLPSAMACSESLLQAIYSILLSRDAESDKELAVTEYWRKDGSIGKHLVPIVQHLSGGVAVPTMDQLPSMSQTSKEEFLFHCLGTTHGILSDIPKDIKIFVALLMFFVRIAKPTTSPAFIYSIVLSFIKLSVIGQDPESSRLKDFTLPDIARVKDRLRKYSQPVTHTNARPFKGLFVHTLSQLQSCWWAVTQLCEILMLHTKLQSPAIAINGTMIYHLHTVLEARTEPLNCIYGNILEGSPTVRTYFDLIIHKVMCNVDVQSPGEKISKKSRKKSKKKRQPTANSFEEEEQENGESDAPPKWEANCDLSNRFCDLLMTEGTSH